METTIPQFGIIGGGELGGALGQALTKARAQVIYYDKEPKKSTTSSIDDLVRTCPVLLLCVPSWEVRTVLKQITKTAHPHEDRLVVAMSKGVERDFTTMDMLLSEMLPNYYDTGVLYGPMIAEEMIRGRRAEGVLAVSDNRWYQPLRHTFSDAGVGLDVSGDMHGVTLCAVLKNIYAIAFGLSEGIHQGLNSKGKLAVMALHEMKQILADFKADPRTAEGIAGLGDLLATGFSDNSFNYRIGKSLAEGIADEHIRSEGLVALDELGRVTDLKKYPLAHTISTIVFHYGEPHLLDEVVSRA